MRSMLRKLKVRNMGYGVGIEEVNAPEELLIVHTCQ